MISEIVHRHLKVHFSYGDKLGSLHYIWNNNVQKVLATSQTTNYITRITTGLQALYLVAQIVGIYKSNKSFQERFLGALFIPPFTLIIVSLRWEWSHCQQSISLLNTICSKGKGDRIRIFQEKNFQF